MMNTKFHFGVSVEEMDPVSRAVYDGLCAGESKKVLSNRYKMPISTVNAISKRFCTGQKTVQFVPGVSTYEQTTENENTVVEPVAENVKEETSTTTKESDKTEVKKRKERKTLSQEEIDTVVEMLKEKTCTMQTIADAAGISISSLYRIKDIYINNKDRMPDNTTEEVKEEIKETNENEDLISIYSNNIRVGLVSERHPMPVNDYIFKDIDPSTMFDYDKLDKHCRNYIENIVDFKDGVAQQNLVVYLSGLQCASASLMKVCNEMKVNLTFRHYRKETDSYYTQIIWNQFGAAIKENISQLLVNSKSSFMFRCNMEELENSNSLVKVMKIIYTTDDKLDYQECILCKTIDDCMDLIKKIIKEKGDLKTGICAKLYKLSKGRFIPAGEFDMKIKLY